MKDILKIITKVLLNAFLVFLAIKLLKYLLIPSLVVALIKSFYKVKINRGFINLAYYFRKIAVSLDQLGNTVCADLFNTTLIKKEGYNFGNPDETISGVLGKNQLMNTLSKIGKVLNYLLNKIETNHSIKSIEKDETI